MSSDVENFSEMRDLFLDVDMCREYCTTKTPPISSSSSLAVHRESLAKTLTEIEGVVYDVCDSVVNDTKECESGEKSITVRTRTYRFSKKLGRGRFNVAYAVKRTSKIERMIESPLVFPSDEEEDENDPPSDDVTLKRRKSVSPLTGTMRRRTSKIESMPIDVVIKCVNLEDVENLNAYDAYVQDMKTEIHALCRLRECERIVKLVEIADSPRSYEKWAIYERMHCDLQSYFNRVTTTHFENEDEFRTVAMQIVDGVYELRQHGIIHRDLKPCNVLVRAEPNGKLCVKLADFNSSFIVASRLSPWKESNVHLNTNGNEYVTIHYRAPELLTHSKYDYRIDVWAMGCIFLQMIQRHRPIFSTQFEKLYMRDVNYDDDTPENVFNVVTSYIGIPATLSTSLFNNDEKKPTRNVLDTVKHLERIPFFKNVIFPCLNEDVLVWNRKTINEIKRRLTEFQNVVEMDF